MFAPIATLLTTTLLAVATAQAGTQVIGVEIGVTTPEQLSQSVGGKGKLQSKGTNKYSGGEMYASGGDGYGIEGLTEVTYIFDGQKKLAAVLMDLDKSRFDAINKALSAKYKATAQQRPFVGDQYVRFQTADAVVELSAPHMSFAMTVNYVRNDLMQQFKTQSKAEQDSKARAEASKF
jgi:hypothetical protein